MLREQLQVQDRELKGLQNDLQTLVLERREAEQRSEERLERLLSVVVEGLGSIEKRMEKLEQSSAAADAKGLEKLEILDDMQREMAAVFNEITTELQKRNVL